MDFQLATLDNASNTAARNEYLASLDAGSADATLAELDSAADARAMADYMAHWYAEQDYRDLRDTEASARW